MSDRLTRLPRRRRTSGASAQAGSLALVVAAIAWLAVPAGPQRVTANQGPAPSDVATRQGRALATRVADARESSGFRMRARVVIGRENDAEHRARVLQLRFAGRREARVTRLLFQVLWPNTLKGHALVLDRAPQSPVTGFLFDPPDRITALTAASTTAPFAGSGLTIEDLADDFWYWPDQRAGGRGKDGSRGCTMLESRPPAGSASAYALVRSCIDDRTAMPRWVDKLGPDGALVKHIAFERRGAAESEATIRLSMMVTGRADVPQTRVEFLRSEREAVVDADEFSPARLARLGLGEPRK